MTWLHGRLALGAGALLKSRLLAGALRLEPEEVRLEGAGRFLGRVFESEAMADLAGAAIAWGTVAPVFEAARRSEPAGLAFLAGSALRPAASAASDGRLPLLQARRLGFAYPGRAAPVLTDCSLDIARGDRLLLESPSGAGKSTLASLLAGARLPEAGLVLLGGLDRASLGARGWRRRVIFSSAVPRESRLHWHVPVQRAAGLSRRRG